MTIEEIHAKCEAVEKRLSDLGYVTPSCHFGVHYLSEDVTAWITYRAERDGNAKNEFFGAGLGKPLPFAALDDFISALPAVEDMRKHDFMAALGRVIDQGRKAGVPVDFLNPLEASMKALSENILTKA